MTVGELKEQLAKFDPESEIYMWNAGSYSTIQAAVADISVEVSREETTDPDTGQMIVSTTMRGAVGIYPKPTIPVTHPRLVIHHLNSSSRNEVRNVDRAE